MNVVLLHAAGKVGFRHQHNTDEGQRRSSTWGYFVTDLRVWTWRISQVLVHKSRKRKWNSPRTCNGAELSLSCHTVRDFIMPPGILELLLCCQGELVLYTGQEVALTLFPSWLVEVDMTRILDEICPLWKALYSTSPRYRAARAWGRNVGTSSWDGLLFRRRRRSAVGVLTAMGSSLAIASVRSWGRFDNYHLFVILGRVMGAIFKHQHSLKQKGMK